MRISNFPAGWPRSRAFPLFGALLALGAPLGLLVLRAILADAVPTPAFALAQIAADPPVFAYLTFATLAVFVLIGRFLGAHEDRLAETSITDPLTRLYNRRHIDARLAEEIERARRHATPAALLLLDVDHLKEINDRDGHEAGDAALRLVADTLRGTSRATDLPARYGGDEFVVLLPSTTANQAAELAERIHAALRARPAKAPVTVSIGVADVAPGGASSPAALFEAADAALYTAKAGGRDRTVITSARQAALS
jgi:diguanylate cyclase (GGDEF)-like protein